MGEDSTKELLDRSKKDQAMRNRFIESKDMSDWDSSVDEENTVFLKELVRSDGWPSISGVGQEASQAAWLLVQHADHDPDFQAYCLELMKALPRGEVGLANIAYLEDRVRVAQGKPQLYGTQFQREGNSFGPQPIEDKDRLNERRAVMGLESFEANKQRLIEQHGDHA